MKRLNFFPLKEVQRSSFRSAKSVSFEDERDKKERKERKHFCRLCIILVLTIELTTRVKTKLFQRHFFVDSRTVFALPVGKMRRLMTVRVVVLMRFVCSNSRKVRIQG